MLLIGLALLVRAQRRRPWDAMMIAASPALALTAMINWDMLALAFVAGIIWAWSTRRPVLAGIFIGLGAATKLYPLFFLGPLLVLCLRERKMADVGQDRRGCRRRLAVVNLPIYLVVARCRICGSGSSTPTRGPDFGSLWLVLSNYGHTASAHARSTS